MAAAADRPISKRAVAAFHMAAAAGRIRKAAAVAGAHRGVVAVAVEVAGR